ncbi:hypothetical protein ES703_114230 [subsurface metagenome]
MFGHKVRPGPLICFAYYAGHVVRLDPKPRKGSLEQLEGGIFAAESIGERHLNYLRVEILYPRFTAAQTSHLLGTEGPAVKGIFKRDNDALIVCAGLSSICTH